MAYFDFIGMIINVAFTFYLARMKRWAWGLGILGVAINLGLYTQVETYAPALLQVVYMVMFALGWYGWQRSKEIVRWLEISDYPKYVLWLMIFVFLSWLFGLYTHAKTPLFDAFATGIALVAILLTITRYIENWLIWIVVDAYYVILNVVKGLPFHGFAAFVYLIVAVYGYFAWKRIAHANHKATDDF